MSLPPLQNEICRICCSPNPQRELDDHNGVCIDCYAEITKCTRAR